MKDYSTGDEIADTFFTGITAEAVRYRYFTDRGDRKLGGIVNMNPDFMEMLDQFRHELGRSISVHAGFAKQGHSPNSKHYLGEAVDCSCPSLTLEEFYDEAVRYQYKGRGFGAIGIYPYWNKQGLHLDYRPNRIQWFRDSKGKYIYNYTLRQFESWLNIRKTSANQISFFDDLDAH